MSLTLLVKKTSFLCSAPAIAVVSLLSGCDRPAPAATEQSNAPEASRSAPQQQAGLNATGAYLREPAPGQQMLAAFVTFTNTSGKAYTLNDVSSPRASAVEVHRTMYNDGVMSMRHVHHLMVPPQSEMALKPGGYHLMLTGVTGEVKPGDQVPLEFLFTDGTTLAVNAEVRPIR